MILDVEQTSNFKVPPIIPFDFFWISLSVRLSAGFDLLAFHGSDSSISFSAIWSKYSRCAPSQTCPAPRPAPPPHNPAGAFARCQAVAAWSTQPYCPFCPRRPGDATGPARAAVYSAVCCRVAALLSFSPSWCGCITSWLWNSQQMVESFYFCL